MCGRYTLTTHQEDLVRALDLPAEAVTAALEPRYNIAPTELVPALVREEELRLRLYQWGLVPAWASDPSIGNRLINARRETVATKPAFRDSFADSRCLLVADGFYEWLEVAKRKPKVPHYIRLKSGEPFTFAGLWARWRRGSEEIRSCTIVTGNPNPLVRRVHDRMPMIIRPEHRDAWLDPDNRDEARLLELLGPYEADEMEMYAVSRFVNSADNEGELCIRPAEPDEDQDRQPTLF